MPWLPEIWEQTPPAAQELIVAQASALVPLQAEVAQKATVGVVGDRSLESLYLVSDLAAASEVGASGAGH
jgi:hypothetical protein